MRLRTRVRERARRRRWTLRIAALHLLLALPASDAAADTPQVHPSQAYLPQVYPSLFGTGELHSPDLAPFAKWRGVLKRHRAEIESCGPGQCDRWKTLIEGIRGLDRVSQLKRINRQVNERSYIVDSANWNMSDYWATPFEFLRRNGDCEDYAIAKYLALRAAGVPKETMRIVVLRDLDLRLAHAVLVVYLDGRALVLDNQIRSVVPADDIRHYRPIYSLNEDGWWLHRPTTLEVAAPATR